MCCYVYAYRHTHGYIHALQVLVLLKMFTFFREVSFAYVFSPVVFLILFWALNQIIKYDWRVRSCWSVHERMELLAAFPVVFLALMFLALKTDSFFGIGTALLLVDIPSWAQW